MVDTGWQWGGGGRERLRDAWGWGILIPFRPPTKRPLLVFPVFLDVEVPLPGQVVMLVIVGKLGFDDVVAAGHEAFRSLLQRGQEVVIVGTRPIAAHHVVRLINCQRRTVWSKRHFCAFQFESGQWQDDRK